MSELIIIHNEDDVRVIVEEDGTFNVTFDDVDEVVVIVEPGEKGDPGVKLTISATEPADPEYKEIWFQI